MHITETHTTDTQPETVVIRRKRRGQPAPVGPTIEVPVTQLSFEARLVEIVREPTTWTGYVLTDGERTITIPPSAIYHPDHIRVGDVVTGQVSWEDETPQAVRWTEVSRENIIRATVLAKVAA